MFFGCRGVVRMIEVRCMWKTVGNIFRLGFVLVRFIFL